MPDQIHDSAMISIDNIAFKYSTRRRFGAYLIVATSDTKGRINVFESPQTYPVLHRPVLKRPAKIDFGFDGFPIYWSIGEVPELARFDVFLVRDRRAARRAGEVLTRISGSKALKAAANVAKLALTAATGGTGAVVSAVASAIGPVLRLIGEIIQETPDRILEAYSGSKIFDKATMSSTELTEMIVSSTGNIETEVDIELFDSRSDIEDIEDLKAVIVKLGRDDGDLEAVGAAKPQNAARRPTSLMLEL